MTALCGPIHLFRTQLNAGFLAAAKVIASFVVGFFISSQDDTYILH